MSVETLATKYRPKRFEDVVAQSSIKTILQNQINNKTFKNAYLFTGFAGTGKTTTARIFANEINNYKGNPIEIDAASNNGVDEIRNIIEDSKKKSLSSEYKIYILDEVHLLSNSAWGAMVILIEAPPKQTIFILCTTNPEKIPNTILSRVQRYDFTKISNYDIELRLEYIATSEEINVLPNVINYIARLANGGMRDAITMFDKVLASKDLSMDNVVKILGKVDYSTMFQLADVLESKSMSFIPLIEKLEQEGKDLRQFLEHFSQFIIDLIKYRLVKNFEFINIPETEEYRNLMNDCFSGEFLQSILSWSLTTQADLRYSTNPKYTIEGGLMLWVLENR